MNSEDNFDISLLTKEDAMKFLLLENKKVSKEVLDLFYTFALISRDYINIVEEYLNEDVEFEYQDMNINQSINLVCEFLKSISPQYLEEFNRVLKDDKLKIYLLEEAEKNNLSQESKITPKPNAVIYIPIKNTVEDGASIIHEFIHYLNDTDVLVGTREIFTEMLSIYFEFRYYQFLSAKGYDNSSFHKEICDRLNNTVDSAYNLISTSAIFDIYNITGEITEESIMKLDESKNLYKNNVDNILAFYEAEDFNESMDEFRSYVAYVIGTLLAIKSLNDVQTYDIIMKYLNENINNSDLTIEKVLQKLGTNINEYPDWIDNSIDYLEKALGEIYGKNHSDSGTYWSRKN